MKTNPRLFLCSLLLLLPLYPEDGAAKADPAWLWHSDATHHFKLSYPGHWELRVPDASSKSVFIKSPLESESDDFRENLGCLVQEMDTPGISVFEAEEEIRQAVADQHMGLISLTKEKRHGVDSVLVEYAGAKEAGGRTYQIHVLQRQFVLDDTLYTLTYTATEGSYAKFLPLVEKMLESLAFEDLPVL